MGYGRAAGQGRRLWRRPAALALSAAIAFGAAGSGVAAAAQCDAVDHAGNSYTVCIVDLRESDLQLFWQNNAGEPFITFAAVNDALAAENAHLGFAMNAGMFDADHAPIGLYVENGQQLVAANTNEGPGNFHLLPNGVFYWAGDTAGIMETNRFLAEAPQADFATQSGPMLLIDGEVHPRFLPDSDSRKIRNGVGIIDEHTVAFAISENSVTFYEFALLFRDRLGVRNALFLDGSVSEIYVPELNRHGLGWFGPIVGVVER
jgi:prepilin-type processing-associated H-X9-DG protein